MSLVNDRPSAIVPLNGLEADITAAALQANASELVYSTDFMILRAGDGAGNLAQIAIPCKTKAGAPTTSDVPAGTAALIDDTTNNTTKLYFNKAGTLRSVALT